MLRFIKVITTKNKNDYNIIMGFSSGHSTRELFLSLFPRSNRKLKMLVFKEGGKPEDPEQNPRSKDENNQLNLEVHGRFVPTVISHPVVLQPNTVDLYPI